MLRTTCPGDAFLLAFHLGELPEEALEEIGNHLESCKSCEQAVEKLEQKTDSVHRLLRQREIAGFADTANQTTGPDLSGQPSMPTADAGIPGYDILDLLGQGGMGIVYKARDRRLDRIVALKRMRSVTPAQLHRFQTEAKAVAQLQHANIVQVSLLSG